MATSELYLRLWGVVGRGVACFISPSIHQYHLSPNQNYQMIQVCYVTCLCFIFHSRWVFILIFFVPKDPLFSVKWLLSQYLAFSNHDLFMSTITIGLFVQCPCLSCFLKKCIYFNVLPHSLLHHISPPSLRGIPILSFFSSPLGDWAPLCPCNMTSG